MSNDALQSLAREMKVMSDMAAGQLSNSTSVSSPEGQDFRDALVRAIQHVNQAQNSAQANVQAFSLGEGSMTLEEVMVSLQKANLSFQTMIAVRNRLVDAYKEVTNLQV